MLALYVALAVSATALADTPKYPNVDSLKYWNRSLEVRDQVLRKQKELADARGNLETQTVLFEMRKTLFERQAIAEQDYRKAVLAKEMAELDVKITDREIAELEIYDKIALQQYAWAKDGKAEVVVTLSNLYKEQWGDRVQLGKLRLARIEAELRYLEWLYEADRKLYESKTLSKEEYIRVRDERNEAISRRLLELQRIALAETGEEESKSMRSLLPP